MNTAHYSGGGVLIHNGESIVLHAENVQIEFSGHDEPFHGTKTGRMYLTTHRLIFINKNQADKLQSFSFPYVALSGIEIEQPVFGSNFIKGKVKAQPNGNWTGDAKFKLNFKKGGALDFGQAMLKMQEFVSRFGPIPEMPPPYTPPPGNPYMAPPPAYTPTPGGYYGWNPPTQVFPDAPAVYSKAQTVFMTDAPPPYPGIYGYSGYTGYANAAPPPMGFAAPQTSNDAKATEAAQSAYYDPNKPQCAYVPPPAYYEPPPPYQGNNDKKDK